MAQTNRAVLARIMLNLLICGAAAALVAVAMFLLVATAWAVVKLWRELRRPPAEPPSWLRR